MTVVASSEPTSPLGELVLEIPPEPVELRGLLRDAVLGGADWHAEFGPELGVGDVLWAAWGDQLAGSGMARATFTDVIAGYRRELWFWLLGDRIWDQVATGLAGRLVRRLPTGSSS